MMALPQLSPPAFAPESDLVKAIESRRPLEDRLRAVELEFARAAATLDWLAAHPCARTLEDGRAISRRLRGLRKYLEIELRERRELGRPELDLKSDTVERVVELLLETFHRTALAAVSAEQATEMVDETRRRSRGWQDGNGF